MDEQEFMKAYDLYGRKLFRHCSYRVYDRERAKEIVQDAFTRTWDYLAKGNRIDNMQAFLYRVVNNLIVNESKRRVSSSLEVLHDAGFDPGEDTRERLHRLIDAKRIRSMLARLDESDREIIILRYIDDLGPKEIAALLGKSQNVISVRLNRAMKEFRKIMDAYGA